VFSQIGISAQRRSSDAPTFQWTIVVLDKLAICTINTFPEPFNRGSILNHCLHFLDEAVVKRELRLVIGT